jgi:aldehyde dehydrogenase (NAD(P)+)
VGRASQIKQLPADTQLRGEEWISGPYPVLASVAALRESLAALERGASPIDGYQSRSAPGGRVAIRVLRHNMFDRLLFSGFQADVWMPAGVDLETVRRQAGLAQRDPARTAGVGVVLGAGNITSIGPLDCIYQLIAKNRVTVLKLNPVTDPLRPVLERALAPLVSAGVLRIVRGGAEAGGRLIHDPRVAAVHMTGAAATHDAIVFGPGEEGRANKQHGHAILDKPVTSELGGVSPTIVLPGRWSRADLRFQAEHIATQKLHNNGFNCVASQVLVISADWAQKDEFLTALRSAWRAAPARAAYYPGADPRLAAARDTYPDAEDTGSRILITGIELENGREPALTTEYFAPVLVVAELPGLGAQFLDRAVTAANERLYGTLGANLIAHPTTLDELGAKLDQAVAALRYGTIAINARTGVGYLSSRASWGAYPGHTPTDIQSGTGIVHNALLLENPERTVVRGPFRPAPRSLTHGELSLSAKPPWFVTNKTAATTGRRLAAFTANPTWMGLPAIFASALRG